MELVADVVTTIVQEEWTTYRVTLVKHADGSYQEMKIEPIPTPESGDSLKEAAALPSDYYI